MTLSAHCATYGVTVHELGHVVGFWHEHSRSVSFVAVSDTRPLPLSLPFISAKSIVETRYDTYAVRLRFTAAMAKTYKQKTNNTELFYTVSVTSKNCSFHDIN